MTTNTLTHHGILGMRWGKRNGPPYPLEPSDMSAAEKKQKKSQYRMSSVERKWARGSEEDTNRVKDYKPRSILTTKHKRAKITKQMSDEELEERIKRLQKETQYLQLEKNLDSLDVTTGKSMAVDLLNLVGKQILIPVGVGVASSVITSMLIKSGLDKATVDAARIKLGLGKAN